MYSLNEQLGQAKSFDDQTRAAHNDHWRQAIYRSVSYDAVNTGTKGTVRSNTWKRYRDRKASLFADPGESEYLYYFNNLSARDVIRFHQNNPIPFQPFYTVLYVIT